MNRTPSLTGQVVARSRRAEAGAEARARDGTPFVLEMGLQLMPLRTIISSALLVLLLSSAAGAQDSDGPRWPDALKKRNARYALLGRVDDARGDHHENDLLITPTRRVGDRLGDREEAFRDRMAAKSPPRASQHAVVRRVVDDPGDEREVLITRRPNASRHAETRRFRDFAGDEVELAKWRNDKLTAPGPDDMYGIGKTGDSRNRDYFDQREEVLHKDGASPRDRERDEERFREKRAERDLMRDENILERQRERLAEQAERDAEKDADKAEKDEEKAAEDDDAAAERAAEQAAERTAERADRATDRQIQRQEDKPAAGSSR